MEQLKQVAQSIRREEPMRTISENQQISTTTLTTSPISREEHSTLFAVINQSRLANGWITRTAQELDPTIRVWFKLFNYYRIPVEHADRLYLRALDLRQTFLQNGKEPPILNAELLAAGWTGQNGLKSEIEREEIAKGRTLGANAESVCRHCQGTGWKMVDKYGDRGAARCNHE